MRVGVYLCNCGPGTEGQISAKVEQTAVAARLSALPDVAYVEIVDFACSEAGQSFMVDHLREHRPDRVVVAACSPREHETTFRLVLLAAGMNPYLLQMVNVREQVAWVTEDRAAATAKAEAQIRAGVARVRWQAPLEAASLEICPDVLVIGGGPAGLKATLALAEAGRRTTLVEKGPILGGLPVRIEEIFPHLECAPCLLEPILGEVLHGPHSRNVDLHLDSEVVGIKGSFGNFDVRIRTRPRHVSVSSCVGCTACIPACPVTVPDPVNLGRTERKAIDFELFGGLPNVPWLDRTACTRFTSGDDCTLCRDACPVENTVRYDDTETIVEKKVGAVIVAVGAELYDVSRLSNLGHGRHPDVLTSWAFERLVAANGPTAGELKTHDGRTPRTVAIVHCAGSLDADHVPYCSAICCQNGFKYVHLIQGKLPDAKIVSLYKTIVTPGKDAFAAYQHAAHDGNVRLAHYAHLRDVRVDGAGDEPLSIAWRDGDGPEQSVAADLIVLLPPLVPSQGVRDLAGTLELGVDAGGFFEEHHGRSDATRSKVRGMYIAGGCQSPMDIQGAMTQGMAASAYVLASLVEGRTLEIEPVVAEVDARRCSACRTCISVCPYKAIAVADGGDAAVVNRALCAGCGTCVAACPSGAMHGHHFTDAAIYAEIEALLS